MSPVDATSLSQLPDSLDYALRVRGLYLSAAQAAIATLGFAGTITALVFAFRQYQRSEQWRRAEFLAREMKVFFDNPRVQNALTMIDWGIRYINLFLVDKPKDGDLVLVSRPTQVLALVPHTVMTGQEGSDIALLSREGSPAQQAFTSVQAVIRDTYDALLDGLERFSSYLSSGLVTAGELRPYLGYWLKDLAAPARTQEDAAWNFCLFAYIEFYGFEGVQALFKAFDYDITFDGPITTAFAETMSDKGLREAVTTAIREARSTGTAI